MENRLSGLPGEIREYMTDQETLAQLRSAARDGLHSDALKGAPTDGTEGPSPTETNGENPAEVETKVEETEESTEAKTQTEENKSFWDQYKSDEDRRKAFDETKRYAAQVAKEAKEAKEELERLKGKPASDAGKTETKTETETKVDESEDAEYEEKEIPLRDWIKEALELKSGHTEDQAKIVLKNREVVEYQTKTLQPAAEAAQKAEEALTKAKEELRDQQAHLTKLRKKAESNPNTFADDIKEAESELRDLRQALDAADREQLRTSLKLTELKAREERLLADAVKFAAESVARIHNKSREEANQRKDAKEQKAKREADSKAWEDEFGKALEANGLKEVSDAQKKALKTLAESHIRTLIQEKKLGYGADLQPHIKDSFSAFLELKNAVPAVESGIERKKSLSDEPGPKDRKGKTSGDEQPTLAELRARARKGIKSDFSK